MHIWQLSTKCIIATIHIVMRQGDNFIATAQTLKKIFHDVGIHSTTIQPEFVGDNMELGRVGAVLSTEDVAMDISMHGFENTTHP